MSGNYQELSGLSDAEKAGATPEQAVFIHELAVKVATNTGRAYSDVYNAIVKLWQSELQLKINDLEYFQQMQEPTIAEQQEKLNKFSQKGHPGLGIYDLVTSSGTIMKTRDVNKSSKGKHPSNYTPPKKKRK